MNGMNLMNSSPNTLNTVITSIMAPTDVGSTVPLLTIPICSKTIPIANEYIIYPAICAIHGFAFGILYSPAQAIMFGLNFKQTVAWIISGLPFDMIHGFSNLAVGLLIVPLADLIRKLSRRNIEGH